MLKTLAAGLLLAASILPAQAHDDEEVSPETVAAFTVAGIAIAAADRCGFEITDAGASAMFGHLVDMSGDITNEERADILLEVVEKIGRHVDGLPQDAKADWCYRAYYVVDQVAR